MPESDGYVVPETQEINTNAADGNGSPESTKVIPESDECDEGEMDYASQMEEIRLRHIEYIRLSPSPKIKKQFPFITARLLENMEDNQSDTSGGKKYISLTLKYFQHPTTQNNYM